jgi:hypothetical protein
LTPRNVQTAGNDSKETSVLGQFEKRIIPQGLNRLRKKPERKANSAKDGLAGAEARLFLLTLSARLKPCPCYKAVWIEFFRSL